MASKKATTATTPPTTGRKAEGKPRARTPQLNITITEEWRGRIPALMEKLKRAARLGRVEVPDVVMAGLALLDQWCDQRIESGAFGEEVAALGDPTPQLPEKKEERRGRPRKLAVEG